MEREKNRLIEPAMWLLIYLMAVDRLREKASGRLIRSAADLRSSTARELEVYGGRLFAKDDNRVVAAGDDTPAYNMDHELQAALKQAGSRWSGGFSVFRGDFKQETAVAPDEILSVAFLDADPSESSSLFRFAMEQMYPQLRGIKSASEMTDGDAARVEADWLYSQLTAAISSAAM